MSARGSTTQLNGSERGNAWSHSFIWQTTAVLRHCQHYGNRCERRLYCVCAGKWSIKNKSKRSETSLLLLLRKQNALIMPAELAIKRFITAGNKAHASHCFMARLTNFASLSLAICIWTKAGQDRVKRAGQGRLKLTDREQEFCLLNTVVRKMHEKGVFHC